MGTIFMRGLLAIAPIALTVAGIIWVVTILEGAFSIPLVYLVGRDAYFTGMGILVAMVAILLMGLVINNWIIQWVYRLGEAALKRIPLVKTLYNAISDLMGFMGKKADQEAKKVVVVEIDSMRVLGMVTREAFDDLPDGFGSEGDVAVFLPFSYQIGGYTVVVPASRVHPVDMTVEAALRFAATAGVPGRPASER